MLRIEANEFPNNALFDDQKKAKEKLEAMLEWAGNAAKHQGKHQEKHQGEAIRRNRILLLHGVSGVGKTSVYLSVRGATKDKYVWLDGMETAFPGINVLADLLILIDEKLRDIKSVMREHGERSQTVQHLRELQNRISEIWDGVPESRAASVGPQAFAAEVLEVSRYRARLRDELNKLIDAVSMHFFEGRMLILPVDDIHENDNAIECLRLFRFIHSPKLVVLAIGNFELMRKRVAKEQKESEGTEDDAKKVIAQQSYLRIDKIVPASHRVELLPPDPANDLEWIKKFPSAGLEGHEEGGTLWERFLSVSKGKLQMESWGDQKLGLWLFKTTPRHLRDMHLRLPQLRPPQTPLEEPFDIQDFIWRQLEVVIYLSGWLHDKNVEQLLEVVRTNPHSSNSVMELKIDKDRAQVEWTERKPDQGLVEYRIERSRIEEGKRVRWTESVELFPTIQAWLRLLVGIVGDRELDALPKKDPKSKDKGAWLDDNKQLVLTWLDPDRPKSVDQEKQSQRRIPNARQGKKTSRK